MIRCAEGPGAGGRGVAMCPRPPGNCQATGCRPRPARGDWRPAPAAKGFTLIEVVLAMILVGMIIAIGIGGIRMSRQAAEAGEHRIEAINAVRTTQEFLRRQLSRVLPLAFDVDRTDGRNIIFVGEERELTFVAPMPGYLSKGGPYVQRLAIERDRLNFYHRMLISEDEEEGEPVTLLDRIRRGRFEYRGIDEEGKLGDWDDEWEDPARTPMMVRLDLEFQDGTHMHWPLLEVPLLIDVGGVNNAYRFFGSMDRITEEMSINQAMLQGGAQPGGVRPQRGGHPDAER